MFAACRKAKGFLFRGAPSESIEGDGEHYCTSNLISVICQHSKRGMVTSTRPF